MSERPDVLIPLRAILEKGPLATTAKYGHVQLSKWVAEKLQHRGLVEIDESGFANLTDYGRQVLEQS